MWHEGIKGVDLGWMEHTFPGIEEYAMGDSPRCLNCDHAVYLHGGGPCVYTIIVDGKRVLCPCTHVTRPMNG